MIIVKCMLCERTEKVPVNDWLLAVFMVVSRLEWAMSQNKDGVFVCCEACYPEAFDLSKGGSVGFLKEKYSHLRKHETQTTKTQ
jgi:hypothetical protein